jgi:hypothetical protein
VERILDLHGDKWSPEPNTGCYVWTGALAGEKANRPILRIAGKNKAVSRLVCEEMHGPPPTLTHEAAHATLNGCIGSICVNGAHIRWATKLENEGDKTIEVRSAALRNSPKGRYDLPIYITLDRNINKYKVFCKKVFCGYYKTIEQAVAARDKFLEGK